MGASIDICSTINTKAGDLATQVCDKVTEKSSTLGSVCTSALDALMEKADAKCKETVGEELVQEQSGASIVFCIINSKAEDLATSACDKVTEKSSTAGSVCTTALDYIMEKADAKCTDTDTDTDTDSNAGHAQMPCHTDTDTDTGTDTDTDTGTDTETGTDTGTSTSTSTDTDTDTGTYTEINT